MSQNRPDVKADLASFKNDELLARRVSFLRPIERKINQEWIENETFQVDAPSFDEHHDKYFATFPFPYMNGRLHLGHMFTFSKAEFESRYQKMKGKYVCLPFGFHCSGMPILASANKLEHELNTGEKVTTSSSHSKVAAKTEVNTSQFDILLHMKVPVNEISEFSKPEKWLEYFSPIGKQDLIDYGSMIDWRRSFITTNVNPYFDKFVIWQFNKLNKEGFVTFGKRPTIYSIRDQQPCLDHDRQSGEGVQPQEYTLIKLQLIDPHSVDERFDGTIPVILLAATLRPETMIGQTNFWYKPDVTYDVIESFERNEFYVMGSRSLRNAAAQNIVHGFDPLFTIDSNCLLGAYATHKEISHKIVGLPLPDIKMNKGTGIVTSVPSDAPADYQGIIDLQKNHDLREKYHVDPSWLNIEPILIISTPKYGDFVAKNLLDELKNSSLSKSDRLEEAKKIAYKEGFYHGTMLIGPFKGVKVLEAKEKMKHHMIEEGSAIQYYEPENIVISRSNDECVVMLCDQWYIEYGKEEWKQKVIEYFKKHVNCFQEETREKFLATFEWLGPWACSRQFGLGTYLPFSREYLIDSLSDSTIYMAYYTICHLLQGNLNGSIPGSEKLEPEQINDEFFDSVFLNGPIPKNISKDIIEHFRREFNFWYPVDCRVSGKDLVTNHLTMYLYNHLAIFPEDKFPIGIRVNGHLRLNNEKMSKSTGNFLTASEAIDLFSATGVRIGLADSGDGNDDANFDGSVVKAALARLSSFTEFVINTRKERNSKNDCNNHDDINGFFDELFKARLSKIISITDSAYKEMMFKAALKSSFFELQNYWSEYANMCKQSNIGLSRLLIDQYINTFLLLLTPIIPHYTNYIWMDVLGKPKSIIDERFPESYPYNPAIFYMDRLLRKTADTLKFKLKSLKKFKNLNHACIFIKTQFSDTQKHILKILRENYNEHENKWKNTLEKAILNDPYLNDIKNKTKNGAQSFMPFIQFLKEAVPKYGSFLLNEDPEIDQKKLYEKNTTYFLRQLPGIKSIDIYDVDDRTIDLPTCYNRGSDMTQVYISSANFCHID